MCTPATLTSHPWTKFPSGIVFSTPVSIASRSTISISANLIRSSNPDAVGMPDTIISSTSFRHFVASLRRFVSSKRSSEDDIFLPANDSRNYLTGTFISVFGNNANSKRVESLSQHTTWSLSCQNSFSFALSRKGNSRIWCTKM